MEFGSVLVKESLVHVVLALVGVGFVCLFVGFFTAQQHTRGIIVSNKLFIEKK